MVEANRRPRRERSEYGELLDRPPGLSGAEAADRRTTDEEDDRDVMVYMESLVAAEASYALPCRPAKRDRLSSLRP